MKSPKNEVLAEAKVGMRDAPDGNHKDRPETPALIARAESAPWQRYVASRLRQFGDR